MLQCLKLQFGVGDINLKVFSRKGIGNIVNWLLSVYNNKEKLIMRGLK